MSQIWVLNGAFVWWEKSPCLLQSGALKQAAFQPTPSFGLTAMSNSKVALITGVTGQDGAYLA
ncbi:MAG: hypothetical protein ACOH2M_11180, partial [Cypionkella sp.]